jgi:RHS repeat-associated protein
MAAFISMSSVRSSWRSAWVGAGTALGLMLGIASASAADVSAAAVTQAAHFEEKLVPIGTGTAAENAELLALLDTYRMQTAKDDFSAFEAFLARHPRSPWRFALLADMGLLHYHYGYFSRATAEWQEAWDLGRGSSDPEVKALADRMAGELLRMHARIGHADVLEAMITQLDGRALTGQAAVDLKGARQGLWMMQNNPGVAYLCGPMALKNLLLSLGRPVTDLTFLDNYRSGPHGVTLAQVADLAAKAHIDFRLVHRDAGQPIPIPSVVHWKISHFAAIVGEENGRYHIKDPTFGDDLWVARGALDSETSGYYLAVGKLEQSPWRQVAMAEAATVRGMGYTNSNDPRPTHPHAPKCPCGGGKGSSAASSAGGEAGFGVGVFGMAAYTFNEMLNSLTIMDTPVGYTPQRGPMLPITIAYNQLEASQPANFTFFNVSPRWSMNWLAYIQDDPTNPGNSVARIVGGGGSITETGYNGLAFSPEEQTGAILTYTPGAAPTYTLTFPDGSANTYGVSNGATTYPRVVFLTAQADSFGNKLTFTYDSQFRLTKITDATSRVTTFGYSDTAFPLQVTTITDPFKRSAILSYDTLGRLSSIKDAAGFVSSFAYDTNSFVNALTTPYGTTNFVYGQNGNSLYLQATDPLGYTERTEFIQGAPNIPFSDPTNTIPAGIIAPFNQYLNDRDTYYWDKHAYAVAAGNYSMARQRHWAHLNTNTNITSDVIESVKFPLENRIWFNYPGQPNGGLGTAVNGTLDTPSIVGRVLDDGSTQLTQRSFNAQGNLLSETDPVGRQTILTYAQNGQDLLSIAQKTASGPVKIGQYGSYINHKPQTYTDASGQVWKSAYNAYGQLTQSTDPTGKTIKYTYDASGNLLTLTDQNGKVALTYTYDGYDRVATRTDSEGWKVSYAYDAFDRLIKETYPDGTSRQYVYSKLDLAQVTDRQGRITKFTYDADRNLTSATDPAGNTFTLAYFENGKLKSMKDGNGNTTSWGIDVQSRPTGKTYADGTTSTRTYQNTIGRLASITDALGQVKSFSYTPDNRIAGITYQNAANPTPGVSYTYDPYFPRVATMTDGYGTTKYTYVAPGQLGALSVASETGPAPNANVSYKWDPLGRVVFRSVGGDPETFTYDALSRAITHGDDIGEFTMTYLGETGQITNLQGASVGTTWTYDTNTNDRRLTSIGNGPNARSFAYTSTPESDITGIKETLGTATQSWTDGFDKADRLTSATLSSGPNFTYTYDKSSNITSIKTASGTTSLAYNTLNQVNGYAGKAFTYDANGNLTQDDLRTYKWDAENRLVQIGLLGQPGVTESFAYDGRNHLVKSIILNGTTTTETHYFWCGETLCEERNANDKVIKRYFVEGEEAPAAGTSLYYGLDQIGSVRDVLSAQTGGLVASADYDPYGNLIKSSGSATNDFRYGQLFFDAESGLYRANFRQYDSRLGRFISRNPTGESLGPNLYAYTAGNPVSYTDPLGADVNPADQVTAPDLSATIGVGQSTYSPHTPKLHKEPSDVQHTHGAKGGKGSVGKKGDHGSHHSPAPHKPGSHSPHPPKNKGHHPGKKNPGPKKTKCQPGGKGGFTVAVGGGLDALDDLNDIMTSDASDTVTVTVNDGEDDYDEDNMDDGAGDDGSSLDDAGGYGSGDQGGSGDMGDGGDGGN